MKVHGKGVYSIQQNNNNYNSLKLSTEISDKNGYTIHDDDKSSNF